jgi:cation diffusion facilitator CzcD-associated flavoprotein CzcO
MLTIRNYQDTKPGRAPVPSVSPWVPPNDKSLFVSPMYRYLETNIPHYIMAYHDTPFPEDIPPFPSRTSVVAYVQDYASKLQDDVDFRFNALVKSVERKTGWEISWENLDTGSHCKESYDAVVLASGHYTVPFIPDIAGLKEWSLADEESIKHAKYFIDAQPYRRKKVLVIGNAASGRDVSVQLSAVTSPVYRSIRAESSPDQPNSDSIIDVSEVVEFDFENSRSALLKDGSRIKGIEAILFCTGYLYSFPFLKTYVSGQDAIITDGARVRRLYRQMFYIPDPTLSVVGMQWKIIPMPMAESQGAVIARVLSGRLALPGEADMRESEKVDLRVNGEGRNFHCYSFPNDVEYSRELYQWAEEAEPASFGFKAEQWTKEKEQSRAEAFGLKDQQVARALMHADLVRAQNGQASNIDIYGLG